MGHRKLLLPLVSAGLLLLLGYIGFLSVLNFKSQRALHTATLKRFRFDLEKRAASLEYYFSERKFDLNTLALSGEINSYFKNKMLGMSETYGLKVNIFLIQQLLKKTLDARDIQGDPIYQRMALIDLNGKILADTRERFDHRLPVCINHQQVPLMSFSTENQQPLIRMSVTCKFQGKIVGELIVWLSEETLYSHFVSLNIDAPYSQAGLINQNGHFLCRHALNKLDLGISLIPDYLESISKTNLTSQKVMHNGETHNLLIATLPIHNLNLRYIAWAPEKRITGGLPSLEIPLGMGILAIMIVTTLGYFLWLSARQQNALTAKNQQLEKEMEKREQAEHKLAVQRTLRIRSDRLRSLGEMAAGIAHELNQPLVGIKGYAELMTIILDEDTPLPRKKLDQYAQIVLQQVDRMVHIINHVRTFAGGARSTKRSEVDLNEVVRSGLSILGVQFQSHGLALEKDLTNRPLLIQANSFSVEEVLLNLMTNARHAVENRKQNAGDKYQPCVRVTTTDHFDGRCNVGIVVEDNGAGIPIDVANRIFDPFFTTKEPDKGTGLGLSISKSIVESFEGRIRFFSTKDKWTRFEIIFPEFIRVEE